MIKTIIFDLGGVILNRGFWIFREDLANRHNISIQKTVDIFINKYYNLYFSGKISEEEFWINSLKDLGIKENWKSLKEKLLNFYKPSEEMLELVDKLRKNNYKVVLLSDQSREWWPELNKKYSISKHFDKCVISYETGFSKPNIKIYKYVLEIFKSKAEDSLFIDDLEINLIPAEKLGMKPLLFKNCNSLKKDLSNLKIKL